MLAHNPKPRPVLSVFLGIRLSWRNNCPVPDAPDGTRVGRTNAQAYTNLMFHFHQRTEALKVMRRDRKSREAVRVWWHEWDDRNEVFRDLKWLAAILAHLRGEIKAGRGDEPARSFNDFPYYRVLDDGIGEFHVFHARWTDHAGTFATREDAEAYVTERETAWCKK